jgi:glycosyltransferase involved in cell wall biosynthesis
MNKKVKIAFDAKWYFEGPVSNKVVIRNLINSLKDFTLPSTQSEIILLIDRKFKSSEQLRSLKDFKIIFVLNINTLFTNTIILPFILLWNRIDVAIVQNYTPIFSTSKIITYVHDVIFLSNPEFFTLIERIYFWPIKYLLRQSEEIITISNSEKNRIIKHCAVSPEKIKYIYHGVSARFKPKSEIDGSDLSQVIEKFNLPDNFILFVGRLNVRKNIETLIRAFSLIDTPNIKLVILGEKSWKSSHLMPLINSLKIQKNVVSLNDVKDDELKIIYALAKVFCFPSLEEGFGLPPLEAMACGIPVIVSNASSIPEVCGEAGLYHNPKDFNMLAHHLKNLLNDDKIYKYYSEQSLIRAQKFNWCNAAKSLLEVCEEL